MDFAIADDTRATLDRYREFMNECVLPVERVVAERLSFGKALPEINALRAEAKRRGLWLRRCRTNAAAWACRSACTRWSARSSATARSAITS